MTTERDLDMAEVDTDLELDELFAEYDEYYYGGRRGSNRNRGDSGAEVNGEADVDEGPTYPN